MKSFNCFLLILLSSFFSFSQDIKGIIKDLNGLPLPGVSVMVIKSGNNTTSDFDGNFSIDAIIGDEIQFSMINHNKLILKAKVNMVVQLNENSDKTLEEVVVIGYGTKKSGSITGSVIQIKSADIMKTPAQSAIQAIQGRAAGVNIVSNDQPGANPTIVIRGLGTILGGRDPLYIVDGVESSSLNGISPNEIESIDILKDASSLAIYGQKARNGAITIVTKKGKKGAIKVNYDSYFGQKFIQKKVKMADSYRFAYYNNTAAGSATYFNFNQPYNTDWLKEITDTGEVSSNFISFSGGNDNANYYLGVTNYKEKGILSGSQFERTNIASRNEFKAVEGKLKIYQNINIAISNNISKPNGAFTTAYKQSPIVPVKFEHGRWGVPLRNPDTGLIDINGSDRFNNVGNPVAQVYFANERNKNITLSGSIGAELKLMKNLKYTSNFGATYNINKGYNYMANAEIWLSQNVTKNIEDYKATFGNKEVIYNTLTQRRDNNYEWNWDNFFTYKFDFHKHSFNLIGGLSRTTKNNYENLNGTRLNVPENTNYWSLYLSNYNTAVAPGSIVQNSRSTPIVSLAYFTRLEYEFDNKYLLTASVRREGISSFQELKKWAYFPSVSAGWILSRESFLENVKLINFLKIRGGYGEIGNANSLNSTNNIVFASGYNYAFGNDQSIFPGSFQPYQVDPNLTWETMKEVDFGLDYKLINNKLSGSLDLYNRKSTNVILPISLPSVLSPGPVTVNTGEVVNKGVEFSIKYDDKITENLRYSIGGNYSFNKNELTKVNNQFFADLIGGGLSNGQFTKQVIVGQPLGSFYVNQVTGINADGAFTYAPDRVIAGSYIPKFTYGLNLSLFYKNFDFSVDAYGVGGNKIYNGKKAQRFGGENIEYSYLDNFWTPSTPNATNPKPYNDVPLPSTYFVEDGAYLRINNITLGYTLPAFTKKINKIRMFLTATNPFIFTKYSGYSPEIAGDGNPLGGAGIELDAYPTNKTFLFGLNVSF